jgi:hypothetical protein
MESMRRKKLRTNFFFMLQNDLFDAENKKTFTSASPAIQKFFLPWHKS